MNNNPVGAKFIIFPLMSAGNPRLGAPKCELLRKVPGVRAVWIGYKVKLMCKPKGWLLRKSLSVLM